MHDSWTCLMVEDGPGILPDDVRRALKMAACNLHLNKRDTMHFSSDVCNGIVESSWDTYSVGARAGILFRAQIESDVGGYRINFLLNTDCLDQGRDFLKRLDQSPSGTWVPQSGHLPIEEMYRFENLAPSSRLH